MSESITPTIKINKRHAIKLGKFGLLINEGTIGEIQTSIDLCPVPNAQDSLLGMSKNKGHILPVFDLTALLDLPASITKQEYYLFLKKGADQVGIKIDSLPTSIAINDEMLIDGKDQLPEQMHPFCNNYFDNDGLWVDFELFEFLTANAQRSN